jgi:hypothetical protein
MKNQGNFPVWRGKDLLSSSTITRYCYENAVFRIPLQFGMYLNSVNFNRGLLIGYRYRFFGGNTFFTETTCTCNTIYAFN